MVTKNYRIWASMNNVPLDESLANEENGGVDEDDMDLDVDDGADVPQSPLVVGMLPTYSPILTKLAGKEYFPPELHATLDGRAAQTGPNGPRPRKRKVLELQETRHMMMDDAQNANDKDDDGQKALQQLDRFESLPENQDSAELNLAEDEEDYEDLDEEYEDDEEGDYNAETFFDGGDDDVEEDFGSEDEGEEPTY